ncbi:MAG: hypothetical protein ACR2IK_10685 [Chloroflexota bacterium]
MPRVNRDLQRRMAARRDRERRRPIRESRYRFGTPESAAEAEESVASDDIGQTTPAFDPPANGRSRGERRTPLEFGSLGTSTRGGVRAAPLPFSAYTADYAYVLGDLRRVGLVIGSLLVILILLYFVLPH